MSVKTFENNGENISENIVKLKLEESIEFVLYNNWIYIYAEETDFWQLYDKPARHTEKQF